MEANARGKPTHRATQGERLLLLLQGGCPKPGLPRACHQTKGTCRANTASSATAHLRGVSSRLTDL